MPRKRGSRRRSDKTQFVLSLPADIPASDVVTRAKAKGHEVTIHQVHNIRWRARNEGSSASRAGRVNATPEPEPSTKRKQRPVARRRRREPVAAPDAHGPRPQVVETKNGAKAGAEATAERQLLGIVVEFGLPRTEELFGRVRKKVLALASG